MRYYNLSALVLPILVVGCGGGFHESQQTRSIATQIDYINPPDSTTAWRLVKDPASTPKKLILDLVGPSGNKFRGIGFNLKYNGDIIAPIQSSEIESTTIEKHYAIAGDVFSDVDEVGNPAPVMLFSSGVYNNTLMVGIFQKRDDSALGTPDNPGSTAKDCSGKTVLKIGFRLVPGSFVQESQISISKSKIIPENIKLIQDRKLVNVQILTGELYLK